MKKRLYILLILVLSLGFVGCHKDDIRPHPTHSCDEDRSTEYSEKGGGSDEDNFTRDENDGEVITDPNHDEDEDQQIKK